MKKFDKFINIFLYIFFGIVTFIIAIPATIVVGIIRGIKGYIGSWRRCWLYYKRDMRKFTEI